ncbi:MAG TPA: type IX secretion system plug protein domain-containing protein, partial [Chitinophagaceae bacterium]|nr:type IX secretion system plug protein domain-containing protein [Chitinophagaceae bacterium]
MKHIILFFLLSVTMALNGQLADHIYKSTIRSVRLHKAGDPYSYPIIRLNSPDDLDLYFDDLDADTKNYYYSFQLCNSDWTPSNLHVFDFIKGFQNNRITTYRNSSIAFTRYTNYYARVPDKNCYPSRSGNYLLKVFLDSDTSKLVFTKRFLVVEVKSAISGKVLQPFSGSLFRTHQKLQVAVNLNSTLNVFNQEEVKVVLLQNYTWATAAYLQRPTIYRGNYFEYSDEGTNVFPAGREWRWIDLRSIRLMSERMQRIDKQPTRTDVYVKPDGERKQQLYHYYRDLNGLYTIETTDKVNP